jgi:hypothetical protein
VDDLFGSEALLARSVFWQVDWLDNGAYVPLDYVFCESRAFAASARPYHQKVE